MVYWRFWLLTKSACVYVATYAESTGFTQYLNEITLEYIPLLLEFS
jgi:hypothetical protein